MITIKWGDCIRLLPKMPAWKFSPFSFFLTTARELTRLLLAEPGSPQRHTGISFFLQDKHRSILCCIFWGSKLMHFHGLRGPVRSELWEAVLERKQSKVFRRYSSERLREADKLGFPAVGGWNWQRHSLVKMDNQYHLQVQISPTI